MAWYRNGQVEAEHLSEYTTLVIRAQGGPVPGLTLGTPRNWGTGTRDDTPCELIRIWWESIVPPSPGEGTGRGTQQA